MSDQGTLQPTIKRRQQARLQGRVAVSHTLVGALCWLGAVAVLAVYGMPAGAMVKQTVEGIWREPIGASEALSLIQRSVAQVGLFLVPLACLLLVIAILGRLAQVGFLWMPGRVLPELSRVDPSQRGARLWGENWLGTVLRCCLVFLSLTCLLALGLWTDRNEMIRLLATHDMGRVLHQFVVRWGWQIGLCLIVLGFLDYAYERHRFEVALRMTPEELRSEIQAIQGNPQIGAARRGMHQAIRDQHPQAHKAT